MSLENYIEDQRLSSIRRQVRLIQLLDAAEDAGLTPLPIYHLHSLAYLTNVLAPVWEFEPIDGKLLKRHDGPFYPRLQADVDQLVGWGILLISEIAYRKDTRNRWLLCGRYRLNRVFADKILCRINEFPEEVQVKRFIVEVTMAFSLLPEETHDAMKQDATYGDNNVDVDNVIDFDEWKKENCSLNVTLVFDDLAKAKSRTLLPAEKIHYYIDHLARKL